jgi:DNA-binding MarR family transcriptional regulator
MGSLERVEYERLLSFRTGLRRFLKWSAEQAAAAGLTPARHQLLLAIRSHPDSAGPTVSDVAEYLTIRHHSTVELIDRAVAAGLVVRHQDSDDFRAVRLKLTEDGDSRLARLSELHLEELRRLGPELEVLWEGLGADVEIDAENE